MLAVVSWVNSVTNLYVSTDKVECLEQTRSLSYWFQNPVSLHHLVGSDWLPHIRSVL